MQIRQKIKTLNYQTTFLLHYSMSFRLFNLPFKFAKIFYKFFNETSVLEGEDYYFCKENFT